MKYVTVIAGLMAIACAGTDTPPAAPSSLPATFQSGDAQLAYTIDLPTGGAAPFPAVVLGHGSGPVVRSDLQSLSTQFTRRGFAVLRFDKRGVGESGGTYTGGSVANSETVFPQLASDVAAAVRFLRARPEIDARKVGLAGVSQAGWILPHAARELGDAAFVVLLSGPVCSVGLEVFYSDLGEHNDRPLDEVYALLPGFTGPAGYDPLPVLRQLNTPTLWLLGLEDRSIPIRQTLANLETLKAAGRPFDWRTYEGLGHSLGPRVWDDVGSWIARFR